MKIFCKTTLPVPASVITALSKGTLDGVSVITYAQNMFAMGGGFNDSFMTSICNEIESINKPFLFATIWGSSCGNYIYNKYPFVEFVRRHHIGQGNPLPIKVPIFYNDDFFSEVEKVVKGVSDKIGKVKDLLEGVFITGCNETTLEMRATSTDFTEADADETMSAYMDAANKWITAGYSFQKALEYNQRFIDLFHTNFEKPVILQYINGLNGFPCVGIDGRFVKPGKRPELTKYIIEYGRSLTDNFYPMTTIFNSNTLTSDKYVEIQREVYNKPNVTDEDFEQMVAHANDTGIEVLQVHLENVNKFRMFK